MFSAETSNILSMVDLLKSNKGSRQQERTLSKEHKGRIYKNQFLKLHQAMDMFQTKKNMFRDAETTMSREDQEQSTEVKISKAITIHS